MLQLRPECSQINKFFFKETKNQKTIGFGEDRETGMLVHCLCKYKMIQLLWKIV